MVKVSAVIITHDRPQLLKRAVESVLGQTYGDIECIVVDDASAKPSRELCEKYGVKYIYIPLQESRGGNHARNVGVEASKGEYVAFLDDDDYWLPAKTEKQVEMALSTGGGIIYCRKADERILEDGRAELTGNPYPPRDFQGDIHERILYGIPTTTSCLMVPRHLLYEAGLFDESLRFWQEYDLLIRLAQQSRAYFVEEPLTVYRIDTGEKGRLTNKYHEWKPTAAYIYRKHRALYSRLSLGKKLRVRMMFHFDAKERARNCGLGWHHFTHAVCYNLLLLFFKCKQRFLFF